MALEQGENSISGRAEDVFVFAEDLPARQVKRMEEDLLRPWRVLITDDDEEVHRATTYALRGVLVDGRPLELLHAYSSAEAENLLREQRDVAVGMLDVVMETADAGLRLVDTIRNELGLRSMRIVLRTGQPGYAPELDVIRRYDINDYRTKAELTQTRLITTLTAGLRAYEQLEQIRRANHGLDSVALVANEIFRLRSSADFSRVLLQRLGELLDCPSEGVVCLEERADVAQRDHGLYIECGTGRYAAMQGCLADKALDIELLRSIRRCMAARSCVFEPGRLTIWLGNAARDAVVVLDVEEPPRDIERRLVTMLGSSLVVGFENVGLIERLDFFAFFDPLTRLPNRTRFLTMVDQDLLASAAVPRCLAIVDVVRFSEINDALGHRCGDSLLAEVAHRLHGALGAEVTISRLSGDCFGLFGPESAIDAATVRRAFERPFIVHGHALAVQVRMGRVRVSQSRGNAVELLRNASLALNQARKAGGSAACEFSPGMSEDVQSRVTMLHNLRAAIDFKRGLAVHYQPLVNGATGEVLGAEALLRWRNDFGEAVPPERFIPLAEQTGMINELGAWVLEQALDQLAAWHRLGYAQFGVSVNLSPVQLRAEDFVARVADAIEFCDVSPAKICFDITEAVGFEDPQMLAQRLAALRGLGVRFALDDFGAGQASLRQLVALSADVLKIDRCYVERVVQSSEDCALAATVVALAKHRNMDVIAEGVETAEQAEVLLAMGCETMQGFHFGRPMAPEQFDQWLRERKAGTD